MFVTYGSQNALEEDELISIPVMLMVSRNGPSVCSTRDLRTQKEVQVSYTVFDGDAKGGRLFFCFAPSLPTVCFTLCRSNPAAGLDYIGVNRTLNIRAGACMGKFTVTLIDDQIFEERERFSYTISSSDPNVIVDTSLPFADVYLTDRDGK